MAGQWSSDFITGDSTLHTSSGPLSMTAGPIHEATVVNGVHEHTLEQASEAGDPTSLLPSLSWQRGSLAECVTSTYVTYSNNRKE